MLLTDTILDVLDEYLEHVDTPADVNTGGCYGFALDVHKAFPDAVIATVPNVHAYLCYHGRFYDAEVPYGVSAPCFLPFFRRYDD